MKQIMILLLALCLIGSGLLSASAEAGTPAGSAFYRSVLPHFLDAGDADNHAVSPVNLYIALAMLAETTGSDSRAQLLTALNEASLEAARANAEALWSLEYRDDGDFKRLLGNSLWCSEEVAFQPETLELLTEHYHAAAERGAMGSAAYNRAFQDWLNGQTGGLLEEQVADLSLSKDTLMALVSTIYFRGGWNDAFDPAYIKPDTFHAPAGDIERDFMYCPLDTIWFGDGFSAVYKPFRDFSGGMWFILPEEGSTPEELLRDEAALTFLAGDHDITWTEGSVHFWTPRFEVVSKIDLIEGLRALGITDVFDPEAADFTPLLAEARPGCCITKAEHAACVTVDETGAEAAAYTVFELEDGAAAPMEEIQEYEFVLDRPFLFALQGESGAPLFAGVINQP